MASPVRVRVELRGNSHSDSDAAFRRLCAAFKRRVEDAGILQDHKRYSAFESRGQKKRRKKREAENIRFREEKLKDKLRDYFG